MTRSRLADRAQLVARTMRVEDLIRDVRSGKLTTPFFQRPLKWDDANRVALFDSILQGFPIGTLLLRKRSPDEGEPVRLGKIAVDAHAGEIYDIVDGQQRVHTLASEALGERLADQRAIYYDLEAHELGAVPRGRRDLPAHWLLITTALDSEKLIDRLVTAQLPQSQREEAISVGKRLREYDLPVYFLEGTGESLAREIFRRTNRSGHELTEAEVFDAVFAVRGGPGQNSIAGIARTIEARGFGKLDDHEPIRRALIAVIGKDPLRATADDVSETDVRKALPRARAALLRAVDLVSEAGFPHARLLPYSLALVMLAAFFDRFPDVEDRTRILLRRWLWRGALNGMHRGDVAPIRKALQIIRTNDESEAASKLAMQMAETRVSPGSPARAPLRGPHAQTRIALGALLTLGPRDLTDEPVSPAAIFGDGGAVGSKLSTSTGELSGTLANRILLPPDPAVDPAVLVEMPDEWLETHALSRKELGWLERRRPERALESRAARLDDILRGVFEARAEWDQTDRPSIAALRRRVETEPGDGKARRKRA
jgi:hypothetical protein